MTRDHPKILTSYKKVHSIENRLIIKDGNDELVSFLISTWRVCHI